MPFAFFLFIVVLRTVFLWSPGNHFVVQAYLKPAEILLSLTELMGCPTASLLPFSLSLFLSLLLFICWDMFLCVALAVLKLCSTRRTSNSQRSACLCLVRAGIKSIRCQTFRLFCRGRGVKFIYLSGSLYLFLSFPYNFFFLQGLIRLRLASRLELLPLPPWGQVLGDHPTHCAYL